MKNLLIIMLVLASFTAVSCEKDAISVDQSEQCIMLPDSTLVDSSECVTLKSGETTEMDACLGGLVVSICTNSDCKWQSAVSYQYYPACIKCGSYCTPVCIGK